MSEIITGDFNITDPEPMKITVHKSELQDQVLSVKEALEEFDFGTYVEFLKEGEADTIKIFTVNASQRDMILHIIESKDKLGHDLVRIYRIG